MKKLRRLLSRIRLVYRRSPVLLKGLLLAMILTFTVAMVALRVSILSAEKQAQAAELEYENEILEQKIGQLDSVQGVIDIAKEELGMVDPNVAVIDPAG